MISTQFYYKSKNVLLTQGNIAPFERAYLEVRQCAAELIIYLLASYIIKTVCKHSFHAFPVAKSQAQS
jgi:hypothetical protein